MLPCNAPILELLKSFREAGILATPQALAEASRLHNLLTRRHTFMGRLEEYNHGLLFGVNAFLVNAATQSAYMQWHAKAGLMLPPGGKIERADDDDPIKTALRETYEEAPIFKGIVQENDVFPSSPLVDVHRQTSTIAENPGIWWVLTVGFWVPPSFAQVEKGGEWTPLYTLKHGNDVATARSAARALNDIEAIRAAKL